MSDYEPPVISEDLQSDPRLAQNNSVNKATLRVPFWSENPNVILNSKYVFEFFPTENMSYGQKLNAISRLVIFMTIIGFLLYRSFRILIISSITLFSLHLIYSNYTKSRSDSIDLEGFANPAMDILKEKQISTSPEIFDTPTKENPFSNVLINDYDYNPNKKPAPPISKPEIANTILSEAKAMVQKLNPGQPNIADKLFQDLGEQYVFEQSLRPFYSTASTTIPNDQSGFADFCYGSMISCKEGNLFACARNNATRTTR